MTSVHTANCFIQSVPFLNEPSIIIFINGMNQMWDVDTNKLCYIYIAHYFYFMVQITRLLYEYYVRWALSSTPTTLSIIDTYDCWYSLGSHAFWTTHDVHFFLFTFFLPTSKRIGSIYLAVMCLLIVLWTCAC